MSAAVDLISLKKFLCSSGRLSLLIFFSVACALRILSFASSRAFLSLFSNACLNSSMAACPVAMVAKTSGAIFSFSTTLGISSLTVGFFSFSRIFLSSFSLAFISSLVSISFFSFHSVFLSCS
jgi:hypothetical protein